MKPTILLHPGLGLSVSSFQALTPSLEGHRVLLWPRPGLDGSPARPLGEIPGSVLDAERLASFLEEQAPERGQTLGKVLLVGHSMAGPVIETFARLYPDLVHGLIFLDASIPTGKEKSSASIPGRLRSAVKRAWKRRHVTSKISSLANNPERLPAIDVENAAYSWYIQESGRIREQHPLPDVPVDVVVAVPSLCSPSRILAGRWVRQQRNFVRLLRSTGAPRTRLVLARPSGHNVQKDRPTLVSALITRMAQTEPLRGHDA